MIDFFQAYKNKITNKFFGIARLPARGEKKGEVLLSYLVAPFTLAPNEHFTDPHTNYWECLEIARLFSMRGYGVDIINANNTTFVPKKDYKFCIDVSQNLERLQDKLPTSCKKIMHVTASYCKFQNEAEQKRLKDLFDRRGVTLKPQRVEVVTKNPAYADFLEGFGNSSVHNTYAEFGKDIFPIPISVAKMFDFPEKKDFESARRNFLFFGGGGAVLKGLDLLVEAFADMPEFHLNIVGPAAYEKDFEEAYAKELSLPNITRYPRPKIYYKDKEIGDLMVGDKKFTDITNTCATIIYPSASEGTSGAVIQAMHAGVIPVITPQTGLREEAPGILMETNPTIESIKDVVRSIASLSEEEIKTLSRRSWEYVREHHTKETFTAAYNDFIDKKLKI